MSTRSNKWTGAAQAWITRLLRHDVCRLLGAGVALLLSTLGALFLNLAPIQVAHAIKPTSSLIQAQSKHELENDEIQILKIREKSKPRFCIEPNWQVDLLYRAKKDDRPQLIIVDVFNAAGEQISGVRTKTLALYEEEVRWTLFCLPPEAASYRLRLPSSSPLLVA